MARIDALFEEAVRRGASDLHLAVHQPPFVRVRGQLVPLDRGPLDPKDLEDMLLELVTPKERARLAAELALTFSWTHGDAAHFRASYYVKHSGIAAAFRLVPAQVPSLSDLGMPDAIGGLMERRSGLVLVCGPASSGKTTTLAAMVDHVSTRRSCHVVTIEEPIEHVHAPRRAQVVQREIGRDAPDVTAALESAAREGADVVAVARIETATEVELAMELADRGVLVLASIESSCIGSAIHQLVSVFPSDDRGRIRRLMASCFGGGITQHLLWSIDGKSRVATHEIVVASDAVAALLRDGRFTDLADATKSDPRMASLDDELERLLIAGTISADDALDRALDKSAFAAVLARSRPDRAETLDGI